MCLIEMLHAHEINVKFFGNINVNYKILFLIFGIFVSNMVILVQSDIESGKH